MVSVVNSIVLSIKNRDISNQTSGSERRERDDRDDGAQKEKQWWCNEIFWA
jgi:hypothetical protein